MTIRDKKKETNGETHSKTQLQDWANSKEWSNITHRTYIAILNEVMDFKFEGAQGATLNPEPFFDTNTKQIAKAKVTLKALGRCRSRSTHRIGEE